MKLRRHLDVCTTPTSRSTTRRATRSPNLRTCTIPYGYGSLGDSAPNYMFEMLGWVAFTFMSLGSYCTRSLHHCSRNIEGRHIRKTSRCSIPSETSCCRMISSIAGSFIKTQPVLAVTGPSLIAFCSLISSGGQFRVPAKYCASNVQSFYLL